MRYTLKLMAATVVAAGLSQVAFAADMPAKARPAPAAICPGCNWNGFYIGANVGGSIGRNSTSDSVSVFSPGVPFGGVFPGVTNPISAVSDNRSPAGAIAGGQIGWNWQTNQLVFGIEGDFDWSGQKDTLSSSNFLASTIAAAQANVGFADEQKIKWLATLRGRLGWAQDCWLWYITGGVAWAEVESNYALSFIGVPGGGVTAFNSGAAAVSSSTTKTGWTVGAGVETSLAAVGMPSSNWSFKLEYLYVDLGSVSNLVTAPLAGGTNAQPASATLASNSSIRDHIVRVGLNYRWGGGWAFR